MRKKSGQRNELQRAIERELKNEKSAKEISVELAKQAVGIKKKYTR